MSASAVVCSLGDASSPHGVLARLEYAAPPRNRRLAPAADALAMPLARERRFADEARPDPHIGIVIGVRLFVAVVHCRALPLPRKYIAWRATGAPLLWFGEFASQRLQLCQTCQQ